MGQPGREPTVNDEEILEILRRADDPVLTTSEIAAKVDIGHRGTYDRLQKLADEGDLKMKKVGESGAVWWIPSELNNR
jgi:DNA-binding Lrp family transcriptional regulator